MSNKIQDIFTNYLNYLKDSTVSIPFSREMWEATQAIVTCRTPALDIHFEQCPDGHGFFVLYDSCKHRGCPQCQEIENQKWLHKKKQVLLPDSHMHFVYKLPDNLSLLWLYNKAKTANCMFAAVRKSFRKLHKHDGTERGIVLVFHSHGQGLSYHPHVHCLVSFGGFTDDQKWQEKRISYDTIEEIYRNELQKQLIKMVKSEGFRRPPEMDCLEEIISRSSEKWRIFESEVYKTGNGVLAYLAQHIKSGVITENEIISYDEREVVFRQGHGSNMSISRLKTEDFIVRYLNHIPPKDFRVVRNIGLYANRNVEDTKEYKRILGIEIDERKWEIPKRICPECGKTVIPVSEEDKKKIHGLLHRAYDGRTFPGYGQFLQWKMLIKRE
jgi:endogenous inhibitor of DNA gyrase (YacG/DUF329 family)